MRCLDELKKLNLPESKYAVFGSGPMGIRSIKECGDIDLIVKKELWNNLSKKYIVHEKTDNILGKRRTRRFIEIGNIEILEDWKPWYENVDKLIDEAEIIEGIPFVKLKYVLEWKKTWGREKDIKDVKIIEEYLKTNKI